MSFLNNRVDVLSSLYIRHGVNITTIVHNRNAYNVHHTVEVCNDKRVIVHITNIQISKLGKMLNVKRHMSTYIREAIEAAIEDALFDEIKGF